MPEDNKNNQGQDDKKDQKFVELDVDGKKLKFQADPNNEGEPLKDDNDKPIPFVEKKDNAGGVGDEGTKTPEQLRDEVYANEIKEFKIKLERAGEVNKSKSDAITSEREARKKAEKEIKIL